MLKNKPHAPKICLLGCIAFLLSTCFYFYEYFLQISPSIMTHDLMRDLNIDAGTLGTISAFYYYTYTAFQVPAGLLYARFGARVILTIMVLICSLGALLFGISNHIALLSFGRLLMGAGSAFAFVGSLYLILRWFPIHYFAVLAGITQLMGSVGAIFGAAPLAMLSKHMGWHQAILLISAIGFLLALIIFLAVKNHPKNAYPGKPEKAYNMRKNLKKVFLKQQTWPIALYSCLVWAPIAAFAGLWGVPFLMVKFNISTIEAAKMIAAVWIGIGIGSPLIGFFSEKIHQRRSPLTLSAVIGIVSTLAIIYIPHEPVILGYVFLFGLGLAASGQSLAFAVVTDNHSMETSSAAIGFNNMCVVCGAIFFQPLIGQLLDLNWAGGLAHGIRAYTLGNYQIALSALPLCFVICMISSLFFIRESYVPKAHQAIHPGENCASE